MARGHVLTVVLWIVLVMVVVILAVIWLYQRRLTYIAIRLVVPPVITVPPGAEEITLEELTAGTTSLPDVLKQRTEENPQR